MEAEKLIFDVVDIDDAPAAASVESCRPVLRSPRPIGSVLDRVGAYGCQAHIRTRLPGPLHIPAGRTAKISIRLLGSSKAAGVATPDPYPEGVRVVPLLKVHLGPMAPAPRNAT